MFYDTRDGGRMSSVTNSNDFIMQKHFVKKRDGHSFVQYELNYKKKSEHNFFAEIFSNLMLQYVTLCFLLIKTKLIPFIYHKYFIR
jgi:hypothetical protein